MSQSPAIDLGTLLVYFRDRLQRDDVGLTISPEAIDVRNLPATAHDRHFSLSVPETRNLETYRDADYVRQRERLVVKVIHQITHADEFGAQVRALAVENRIAYALTNDPPPDVRVSFEVTRRSAVGNFLYSEITFAVVHDERLLPRLSA